MLIMSHSLSLQPLFVHFLWCSICLVLRHYFSISEISHVNILILYWFIILTFFHPFTESKRSCFYLFSSYVLSVCFFPSEELGVCFTSHKVVTLTIWYLSRFRTHHRCRLGICIHSFMESTNRTNTASLYICGNWAEYHLPKQMWKDERNIHKHWECAPVYLCVCENACTDGFYWIVENWHIYCTQRPVSHPPNLF